MNIDQAKQDITTWITDFVEKPNALLNGWPPCPYARRARLENKVDIRQGIDVAEDLEVVDMQQFDVIALVYEPDHYDSVSFNRTVDLANQYTLASRGLIALADHPEDKEEVLGVSMNQGTWAIVFVQNLDKLNSHARMLAKQGFYQDWPEEYLKTLFSNREDPRID